MLTITHIDQNSPEDHHGAPDWTEASESGDLQRLVPVDEPKTHETGREGGLLSKDELVSHARPVMLSPPDSQFGELAEKSRLRKDKFVAIQLINLECLEHLDYDLLPPGRNHPVESKVVGMQRVFSANLASLWLSSSCFASRALRMSIDALCAPATTKVVHGTLLVPQVVALSVHEIPASAKSTDLVGKILNRH
eukprot:scaffold1294_cov78-Cylindrotheca_fusiformis.AAC.3